MRLFTTGVAAAMAVIMIGSACMTKDRTLKDSRDGKKYRTVQIGNQVWMAENLNHQFGESGVWCLGKNSLGGVRVSEDESNCAKYGRLYNWDMAKRACPKGWHLPSEEEWTDLVKYVGSSVAGKKLKAKKGWKDEYGTDDFGFSARPGGLRDPNGKSFNGGHSGHWWTADGYGGNAFVREIIGNVDTVDGGYGFASYGFSVRCVAD
jgi:uncharacterized protein (TIGR02145 family)